MAVDMAGVREFIIHHQAGVVGKFRSWNGVLEGE